MYVGLQHETRKETRECFAGQSKEYKVSMRVFGGRVDWELASW